MEYEVLDNKSFEFLKYIYENDECPVKKLPAFINAKGIVEMLPLHNTIFFLFKAEYLSVYNPRLEDIMLSTSYEKYISACNARSIGHLDPNCIICILPKGRVYIEEKLQKQEEFKKHFKVLQTIADSSLEHSKTAKEHAKAAQAQAESAKKQAKDAMRQADSAEKLAKTTQESSESSDKYAKISVALSIIAIIISIIAIALPLLCE